MKEGREGKDDDEGKGEQEEGEQGADVQKCTVDMRGVTLPDRPPKGVRSK